jgi:4'-phosphopantetheinyl transferase EntD
VIERLLSPLVRVGEAFVDRTDVPLFPEEEAAIARAVEKRRREFTTVRACARDALLALGIAPVPLVPGFRGAPRWPTGIVGSMTHCDGYAAAVVAHAADIASIGIDAEPNAPLPEGVLDQICAGEVLPSLTAEGMGSVAVDRLLFSAKESVYKAWFPLTGRWLGFEDALVDLREDGSFGVRLRVDPPIVSGRPLSGIRGRWTAGPTLLLTAVVVDLPST